MLFTFNFLVPLFRPSLFRMMLFFYISIYGTSHRRCSVKKGVFKNFAIFAGKHLFWSLQHRFFPVKSAKFLRTPILKNICERLLLNLLDTTLLHETILKKHTNEKNNFQDGKAYNRKQHFES